MAESLAQQGTEVIKEFIRNPAARSGFNSPLGKPTKPTIVTPTNSSTVNNSKFTLSAYSHPQGVPQKSIQVQRSLISDFSTQLDTYTYADNLTTIYDSPKIVGTMTMYARARYIDSFGVASDWSDAVVYTSDVADFSIVGSFRVGGAAAATSRQITFTGSKISDILVVSIAYDTAGGFTAPNGWTLIHQLPNCLTGSSYALIYKVATEDDEAVTLVNGFDYTGVIIRGLSGASSYVGSSMSAGVASTALPMAANALGRQSLALGFCRSGSTFTIGGNWTKVYGQLSESLSGYFSPFFAWSTESASATVSRTNTGYQAYIVNLTFGS